MLSKILSKETCKNCKFCCSFKRQSLWETPLFSAKQKDFLQNKYPFSKFKLVKDDVFTIDLDNSYKTNDENEEAKCYFLDTNNGCILSKDEKPFDCSIWPFRLMKKQDKLVIALTPTCPAINKIPLEEISEFVKTELATKIFAQGRKEPYIIKEYKDGFPIIVEEE